VRAITLKGWLWIAVIAGGVYLNSFWAVPLGRALGRAMWRCLQP